MKKTKLDKGITLVALIITIVILLILAVTTIAAIQENDIIKYTKDANNEHIMGQEKEQIKLAYDSYKISKYTPIEKTEDQVMLEQYFLGKPLNTLFDETKSTNEMIVFKDIDITLTANDLKIVAPLAYAFFEYNGCNYKLIINLENNLMVESLETDENVSLEIADAEITGNEKIGWDVEFNDTGNKYYISKDGELGTRKWDMAWTSDGTTWSKKYLSEEEITGEYSIIAKMYKTGYMTSVPDKGEFEEYHMIIEGNGQMAPLFTNPSDLETGAAWQKDVNFDDGWDVTYITKVTIGEGITNVPISAFVYGVKLNEITLPSTLENIGKEAFGACTSLQNIIIPERVTTIGKDVFALCSSLKNIYYKGESAPQGQPWGAPSATVSKFSE